MKRATRLLVTLGIAAVALLVFRTNARDVVIVYDLGEIRDATALEVRIEKGAETVRRAEFPLATRQDAHVRQVRHQVRLTDGPYHIRVGVSRPGAVLHADRDITVTESQTIVLPLTP